MNSTRWTLAIAAAIALALFTVLLAIPFMTKTLSDGVQAYSQGDYATAYKDLKPMAADGEPTAQYILGEMYRLGQGVKKDEAAAVKWYKKAAEGGSPEGQYALGMCYATGLGTDVDMIGAYQWLSLSIMRLASWQNERRSLAVDTRSKLLTVMDQSDVEKAKDLVRSWDKKLGGS
jgi:hypothetical protein